MLKEDLKAMEIKCNNILKSLNDKILLLPDNEKIIRHENYFTAKFSEISTNENWSPYYHDFKFMYNLIVKKLKDIDIFNIVIEIEKMITSKRVVINSGNTTTIYNIHPTIVEYLKEL